MDWKKIGKAILFPHLAIIILFLPVSVSMLIFSLIFLNPSSVFSIISFIFAFYMLLVLCFRVPRIIRFAKNFKNENKYAKKWFSDQHLRMNVSLYGSLIWNGAFAIFQLGLGFYHGSFWFYSMFAYYIIIAIMRFFLLKHTRVFKPNEKSLKEVKNYYLCGWLLLLINVALAVIIFFIVYWNKTFYYNEIITITLATYTFVTFTFAIINSVKYKKYNSPVYKASKTITLISACVSMLTLETAMLTTFGGGGMGLTRQILIGCTGGVVSVFTITMAIYMIVNGKKMTKLIKSEAAEIVK